MTIYTYQKLDIDINQLTSEINDSEISQNVNYMNYTDNIDLTIYFTNELNSSEQTILQTLVTNHLKSSHGDETFYVQEMTSSKKITREAWYHIDNGNGTYSGLTRDIVYTYSGNNLLNTVEKRYRLNGSALTSTTSTYYKSGNNVIVKRA